tara:strand:+ start:18414 stop:19250 length:837 start_codon:yes stop_codon:yes gene_type:complete
VAKKDELQWFDLGADASDNLANKGQFIEFYQVPSMKAVRFKAFLTQYEDNFNSTWKRTPVFGKMDPIHTFQHTQRTINLGWDVLAGSIEEAVENQQRISTLVQMLYPSYEGSETDGKRIKTAPIFKVKFMNLITDASTSGASSDAETGGLVCTIDGFRHAPVVESGYFALGGGLFPKNFQLQCSIHVLHTHNLGWMGDGEFEEENFPYAANDIRRDLGTTIVGAELTIDENGTYVSSLPKSLRRSSAEPGVSRVLAEQAAGQPFLPPAPRAFPKTDEE